MKVYDCGEFAPGDDWNICDNDKSDDKLPPFPDDWLDKDNNFTVKVTTIFF